MAEIILMMPVIRLFALCVPVFFLILLHIFASQAYGFYLHAQTKAMPDAESNIVDPILSAQKKSMFWAVVPSSIVYVFLACMAETRLISNNVASFYVLFCLYIILSLVLTARNAFVILKARLPKPHRKNIIKWTGVYIVFAVSGVVVFPLILAGIAFLIGS